MTNLTNETVKELFHIAGQIARENYNASYDGAHLLQALLHKDIDLIGFLQSLGLGHTHRDFKGNAALHRSQKFIFEKNAKITNVMSYSSIKKGIMWSWQWRLLSRYIDKAITEELNKNKI